MEILSDALSCRWGAFVNYLAAALAGGVALYVVTFFAVPIGAILRVRNAIQTDTAIDRFFDIKTDGIFRDSRNIIHVSEQPSIMGQQYRWILSKKGFIQLFSVGAVFFVLAGAVSGTVCAVPYQKPAERSMRQAISNDGAQQPTSIITPVAEASVSDVQLSAVVIPKRINMRSLPSTDSPIETTLQQGDEVMVIGRNSLSTWVFVTFSTKTGWVRSDLLSFTSGDLHNLQIVVE